VPEVLLLDPDVNPEDPLLETEDERLLVLRKETLVDEFWPRDEELEVEMPLLDWKFSKSVLPNQEISRRFAHFNTYSE
jgi:hypothetical protein